VKHTGHRIYLNGDVVVIELDDDEEALVWLNYNKVMRFGCALILDGVVKYNGYYGSEQEVLDALSAWQKRQIVV
jgi:hypothetical protein